MTIALNASPHVDHNAYRPDYLRGILVGAKTIAVVGASNELWRPSFGIMRCSAPVIASCPSTRS